ncbi:MAG: hypothetical protein ACI870_000495 [Crocinitomicaceae bacterium]|jgi:hypothetical protein
MRVLVSKKTCSRELAKEKKFIEHRLSVLTGSGPTLKQIDFASGESEYSFLQQVQKLKNRIEGSIEILKHRNGLRFSKKRQKITTLDCQKVSTDLMIKINQLKRLPKAV